MHQETTASTIKRMLCLNRRWLAMIKRMAHPLGMHQERTASAIKRQCILYGCIRRGQLAQLRGAHQTMAIIS
jgi:hypothetical protein